MSAPTEIVINVKNSILLFGILNEDLTLNPEREYLVSDNLILINNTTLTIPAGTTIKVSDDVMITINNNSSIQAIGNKNNRIIFKAEANYWKGFNTNGNVSIFEFVEFSGIFDPYLLNFGSSGIFRNCLFYGNSSTYQC